MSLLKYFPEGLALGEAFVNRDKERSYLIKRVQSNKHCVLIAPRRYGKTSLVMKVAEEIKTPYCAIDFLAAYSDEYVRDQIVNKVSTLVFELLPRITKAKENLIHIFKKMNPEITIGAFGQKLTLKMSSSPLQDITDLLLKLDETAQSFKKNVVIFMDEFQQISQLKNHVSIEAAIRHAVERSQNTAYVFSGSSRKLLKQMFGDQSRPLYRLCQTINIERMHPEAYVEHLQNLAIKKWKKSLSAETIQRIFELTELHPFYMNVLCQYLWEEEEPPSSQQVNEIWKVFVKNQKKIISHDLTSLSINQKKMMAALAKNPVQEAQSIEFISPLKISASSAQQAIEVLIQNDVWQIATGIRFVIRVTIVVGIQFCQVV